MRPALLALLALLAAARVVPARAAEAVDVALVLVGDVSRSIDGSEFTLEKQGYAAALTSPRVLAAIAGGEHGAIAVAYVEFAGLAETRRVLDWTVVRDAASAGGFATRLVAAPRSYVGRTAIGEALAFARTVLAESAYPGARQVIDVCGDGTNNSGRPAALARDAAVAAGITVNGLVIINDHPAPYMIMHVQPPGGLAQYYRQNVIGGPDAFVLEVHDFAGFGAAIAHKLVQEIAARPAPGPGRFADR